MANQLTANQLYYGDNLEVLRKYIPAGSIDLCYIDPPFNSKRNYNQIYNNIGTEDKAQAQAFTDTWTWDDIAIEGYNEITAGTTQLYPLQCIELIIGLKKVLGNGALMAYLISMTLRIAEIYRVLKPTGSFYLHCDPTASHYLKLVLDSLFCARGGEFQNEITWKRYAVHSLSTTRFDSISDIIFYYSKSAKPGCFYLQYEQPDNKNWAKKFPYLEKETNRRFQHVALEQNSNTNSKGEERIINGRKVVSSLGWRWTQKTFDERIAENPYIIYWTETGKPRYKIYEDEYAGAPIGNIWTDIPYLSSKDKERLGYPTQKPEVLLERIIKASSNEGDTVLDAYCGCGTTIAVAQRLNRNWIGMDITYQSISVILKRIGETFGNEVLNNIALSGIPKDVEAARALALKKDDRVRKEFEKWAVLTYSNNKAMINEKKGADGGIDGIAKMLIGIVNGVNQSKDVLFSVKSGNVTLGKVRDFCHVVNRENAAIGIFIGMDEPTKQMLKEIKDMGNYTNPLTGQQYPKVAYITIEAILKGERLELPQAMEVLKEATKQKKKGEGLGF